MKAGQLQTPKPPLHRVKKVFMHPYGILVPLFKILFKSFKIQEIQDDDDHDDLIELNACGITTKWLYPKNCMQCPVQNCRQKFRTRLDAIKHYKKIHAFGSICCPGKAVFNSIFPIKLM